VIQEIDRQAQAILDKQLRRLAAELLERTKS